MLQVVSSSGTWQNPLAKIGESEEKDNECIVTHSRPLNHYCPTTLLLYCTVPALNLIVYCPRYIIASILSTVYNITVEIIIQLHIYINYLPNLITYHFRRRLLATV